ncbi:TPA: small-conductance mechanosensitive channel MscS [Burkholderia cepacia]|nr:small-conductance mechanosensitive channel MscS [Burkholderia cepacia]
MTDEIYNTGSWLEKNRDLLFQYMGNIVVAIFIFVVGAFLSRVVAQALNRMMKSRGIDVTVVHFLAALVRHSILVITLIAALESVGVKTTSVIAVLGAAGLAVGLALQGSLSNFAAGVLLVVFRPIKTGEYVDLGGVAGVVDRVQIFSTIMRTVDNTTIVIPNGKIIAGNIINYSREPLRRVDIVVGVGYSADIDIVKRVLSNVIEGDKRILHDMGVTVRLNEMAACSLNFVTRSWTTNSEYWDVYFDLMENFKRALDANNINIPYPQMDIHMRIAG